MRTKPLANIDKFCISNLQGGQDELLLCDHIITLQLFQAFVCLLTSMLTDNSTVYVSTKNLSFNQHCAHILILSKDRVDKK